MTDEIHDEHRAFQESIYLERDGELTAAEADSLERHLAVCAACRVERKNVAALDGWLAAAREEADPTLVERVMESLPAAGWETRHPRTWWPAVAALVVVAGGAALVAGLGDGGGLAVAGTARAIGDLLVATALTGAGLLGASWQGLGLALGEIFGGSRMTLAVFAVFVAGVDFLFVRYLLRRARGALEPARRDP